MYATDNELVFAKWLINNNFINSSAIRFAAKNGRLDILKTFHENGYRGNKLTILDSVGHIDCLQYMHENGYRWFNRIMCYKAAECGCSRRRLSMD